MKYIKTITFLVLAALVALPLSVGLSAENKAKTEKLPNVKISKDINLELLSMEVLTGAEIIMSEKEKQELEKRKKELAEAMRKQGRSEKEIKEALDGPDQFRRGMNEEMRKMHREKLKAEQAFYSPLFYSESYMVIKYRVDYTGKAPIKYISPIYRVGCTVKSSDGTDILQQAILTPDERPEKWLKTGLHILEKDKSIEDYFLIRIPCKDAKKVTSEIYVDQIFPGCEGIINMEIPVKKEAPLGLDKIKAAFKDTSNKEEDEKRYKKKGKIKLGKICIELDKVEVKK